MSLFALLPQSGNLWANFKLSPVLKDAAKNIESTLVPRGPIRALVPEDLATLDAPLEIWATSEEISIYLDNGTQGPLVNWMLRICRFVRCLPDFAGAMAMSSYRERFARLECRIQRCLLQEQLQKWKSRGTDLAEDDLDYQTAFACEVRKEIEESLLCTGMKSEKWSCDILVRLFDCLETWVEIPFPAIESSLIGVTMPDIIKAPCVPNVSDSDPFRERAGRLLHRWTAIPEVTVLSQNHRARLGFVLIPYAAPRGKSGTRNEIIGPALPFSPEAPRGTSGDAQLLHPGDRDTRTASQPEELLYRLGEVADALQRLKESVAEGGPERLAQVISEMEKWGKPDTLLAEPLILSIQQALNDLQSRADITQAQTKDAVARLERLLATFHSTLWLPRCHVVTGYSYQDDSSEDDTASVVRLCFRDASHVLPPAHLPSYIRRSDTRIRSDICIETRRSAVYDEVLGAFFREANARYRHPLARTTRFRMALSEEELAPPPQGAYPASVWETGPAMFAQGRVRDLPFPSANAVVYYIRNEIPEHLVIYGTRPEKRMLPESCLCPPKAWCSPLPPSLERPGDVLDSWHRVPSLAFIGSGTDIWPNATYPPLIASHIYIPISFSSLGCTERVIAKHMPTPQDRTPVKLYPPLTVEQAKALLGQTIQYEDPELREPAYRVAMKPPKKKRKAKRRGGVENQPGTRMPDWDQVYCGFVWGFDPERMELKIFAGSEVSETCRTLMVGEPNRPELLPYHYPTLRVPFAPVWLGAVVLPPQVEVQAPPVVIPAKQPGEDRLAAILKLRPREFEVGIGGNRIILVGELGLHEPDSKMIEKIEKCKPGIWESGRKTDAEEGIFAIWVQWVREGSIDLTQAVDRFANASDDIRPLPESQDWQRATVVNVDGGSVSILASGIATPKSVAALTGEDDEMDVVSFVECIVLQGSEDDKFHIPGGIASGTGGDGSLAVDVLLDEGEEAVAVRITGSGSAE